MTSPSSETVRTRRVIGVMTGTSIDALDAALVEIRGAALDMSAALLRTHSADLGALKEPLGDLASGAPMNAGQIARLAREFGLFTARQLTELAGDGVDLIAVHGQTVFHDPPVSWQMIDPTPIAHALRAPVVIDMRAADLEAGGQGAPITPIADWILFRDAKQSRVVVNLGGFCNITHLPAGAGPGQVTGADICACNQVLDASARVGLGLPYDDRGAAAARGDAHPLALAELCGMLEVQRDGGRSLGTGDEAHAWAHKWGSLLDGPDLCRTACEAVAASIAASFSGADLALLAGGGARNQTLVDRLREISPVMIDLTDQHGVPAGAREAMAMAILGALMQDRIPTTLPQVTGRGDDVMVGGTWVLP